MFMRAAESSCELVIVGESWSILMRVGESYESW